MSRARGGEASTPPRPSHHGQLEIVGAGLPPYYKIDSRVGALSRIAAGLVTSGSRLVGVGVQGYVESEAEGSGDSREQARSLRHGRQGEFSWRRVVATVGCTT